MVDGGSPAGLEEKEFFEAAPEGLPAGVTVALEMTAQPSDSEECLLCGFEGFAELEAVLQQL